MSRPTFPTPTNVADADQLPARIGRYWLLGRLAKGGMADTYIALSGELPGLRTVVVVKRILPHLSSNEQFVRMFVDEARIGALLNHPNIPRIIEVGRDEDGYFLAMEAVPGKSLSAILRRALRGKRPLGHAYAAFIVARAAAGLAYAHGLTDADGLPLNIVHRDVSPENILVSFDGAVKVIDFGIATIEGRVSQTFVGGLKGKVEYMSPEQATGTPVDRRSDVFSLGVVLWEALSGRRLFRRETDLAMIRAICDEPIPRPAGPLPIPPRLERIVMTALEREPEARFQDAHEMALLLERYAFMTAGFDPAALVAQVRQLFPADHAGWKATMDSAHAIEGPRRRKITATLPILGGGRTRSGERTVALHKKEQRDEEVANAGPPFPVEAALPMGERSAVARLESWGGAPSEPDSESDEWLPELGNHMAAHAPLRAWALKRRSGLVLSLVGAIVLATVFLFLRPRPVAPVTPPSIVDVRSKTLAAGAPPVVEPLGSAATGPSPAAPGPLTQANNGSTPPTPGSPPPVEPAMPVTTPVVASPSSPPAPRPSFRQAAPSIAPVVKVPGRKRAIAHPAAAVKPLPTPRPIGASEPIPPTKVLPPTRPWTDPFN